MLIQIKVSKISEPVGDEFLPKGRMFAYIKRDYQLYRLSRPSINQDGYSVTALPQTCKVLEPIFMPMTRLWQFYWADLFSLSRFEKLYDELSDTEQSIIKTAFRSVTRGNRAVTNGHSWSDGYADYLNEVNLDSYPMEQETINFGGNVVEVLSGKMFLGGKEVYQVATLNGGSKAKPFPPPDPKLVNGKKTPWLCMKATISKRDGLTNKGEKNEYWAREDLSIPFDQLQGHDVIIPFMGSGAFNYIESRRLEILPDGAKIPSPYVRL